jgi:tRNA threonylcarbamoyl adenosine modification protein (Sua5/YciO/YrdC/YwlC family)
MKVLKINFQEYVIGVDGGGAKTTAILADLNGKILAKAKTGSSHPRNLGIVGAVNNVVLAIKKVLKKSGKNNQITAVFLGLPATEEEFKNKKALLKKELLKHKEISKIFKGKVVIGSDQLAGFRSGTDKEQGIVLIAGSGCVCHGWQNNKEVKVDGWGYLSEMGSAFFVGQKTLQSVFKSLDGRMIEQNLLTKLVLQELKVKNKEKLIELVYSKIPMEIIPFLSVLCDRAAEKGDKLAKKILVEAGKELAFSAKTAISKLNFVKKEFPLVLIGSMFNSKIILSVTKKELKKFAAKVDFIRPEQEPAVGAVKLAIEIAIQEKINKIVEELKKGKIIVFPTDTVYGLVADASNKKAVDKVFKIKQREKTKKLPIFIENFETARKIAKISKNQEKFLKKVWPGKTTVIFKKRPGLKIYGTEEKTIALRIPDYKLINVLLEKTKIPLTGTSANISEKPASGKIKIILKQFQNQPSTKFDGGQPDLIIDAGNLKPSKPSTVIDLTGSRLKILRK